MAHVDKCLSFNKQNIMIVCMICKFELIICKRRDRYNKPPAAEGASRVFDVYLKSLFPCRVEESRSSSHIGSLGNALLLG